MGMGTCPGQCSIGSSQVASHNNVVNQCKRSHRNFDLGGQLEIPEQQIASIQYNKCCSVSPYTYNTLTCCWFIYIWVNTAYLSPTSMLPVTSSPSQPSSILHSPLLTAILYSVQTILGLSHLPSQPPEAMTLPSVLTATSATPAFRSSTLYFFCSWPYRNNFINSAIVIDKPIETTDTGY